MERFATKTALSRGVGRVLSYVAAYICILLLMDMGNQYAGVASFSGRSEETWLVSCSLLALFSVITLACHVDRMPSRSPVEDCVALRVTLNAPPKATGE